MIPNAMVHPKRWGPSFFLSINSIGFGLLCIFPFTFPSMEDPMPYSSSDTKQPHFFHGYPSPFRGNYEEPDPNPPYPHPTSPLRWGFFDGSLHGREEELGFTCVPKIGNDEEDEFQSNGYGYGYGYGNWLSSCWEEDLSRDNATYSEQVETQSGYDYDPWCWVGGGGGGGDEYCYGYSRPEPRVASYNNSEEIMGLCEGVFGYWPCLLREYHETYAQH